MERLKVLLCGDSFAADYIPYDHANIGWPSLLSQNVDLTNLAKAGCSEYRIWQQTKSLDLSQFDRIIVSHTSPYRIYVKHHPVHSFRNELYRECDLIYLDAVENNLHVVKEWFEKYFDLDYAIDIHQMIIREISRLSDKILHIAHMDVSFPLDLQFIDFSDLWQTHRGSINHYNNLGNKIVYNRLLSYIT